ncbi:unnamed protein product [Allacma fusca]|uniref:Secreted protein n=1 Tax=Allacma fusca TaxID=39272 RepID=A0A8J2KL50_9HEXA|nr:unnamed protein product [Allacma fusca]
MRNFTLAILCFILALCLYKIHASPANPSAAREISKSAQRKTGIVKPRQADEDADLTPPPLLPSVAEILGTFLGANQSTVNRTIERLTLSHNGIDPDIPTTTQKSTTREDADEEEEEEEEESNDLNAEGLIISKS